MNWVNNSLNPNGWHVEISYFFHIFFNKIFFFKFILIFWLAFRICLLLKDLFILFCMKFKKKKQYESRTRKMLTVFFFVSDEFFFCCLLHVDSLTDYKSVVVSSLFLQPQKNLYFLIVKWILPVFLKKPLWIIFLLIFSITIIINIIIIIIHVFHNSWKKIKYSNPFFSTLFFGSIPISYITFYREFYFFTANKKKLCKQIKVSLIINYKFISLCLCVHH